MSAAVAVLAVPLLAALGIGRGAFTAVVMVAAGAVLLDLSGLLARSGTRPVVLAALLPAVALPAAAAVADDGWLLVPRYVAAGLLAAFALVLLFGRRSRVLDALGATAVTMLLVGLGATTLVLLGKLADGRAWVLVVLALVAAADIGGPVARRVQARRALLREQQGDPQQMAADKELQARVLVPALLVLVTAGIAALFPPEGATPTVMAALAVVALTASRGADELLNLLAAEGGVDRGYGGVRIGEGLLLAAADGVLLAAPATYVIARAVLL